MTGDDVDRVLLAGATGGTGLQALAALRRAGYALRGVTRSASGADRLRRRGAEDVVVGDLLDPDVAQRAVEGCDAVVSCLGTSPVRLTRSRLPGSDTPLVDGPGNRNLVTAAEEGGLRAFVLQSALGVGGDRGSWLARLFALSVGPTNRAKAEAEAALRDSALRHTIVRPGFLTSRLDPLAVGPLLAAPAGTGLWGASPRRDVARVMVGALDEPGAADATLELVRNPLQTDRGSIDVTDWGPPQG